jgi:uncharacterized protein
MYSCAYNHSLGFTWDVGKEETNRRKHGIGFPDAIGVFADAGAIVIEAESRGEVRFVVLGVDLLARLVVVVYTMCGENIRVISARKATRRERVRYGIQNEERV